MSDSIEFPEGEKVHSVIVPVPAEMMEMLELAKWQVERTTGMSWDSIGHFLGWHLWNSEECGLKLLKEERDFSDPVLEEFPGADLKSELST